MYLGTVTVSVGEETPYLSGLLAGVTVMTLMTLIYGLILDRERISTSQAITPSS